VRIPRAEEHHRRPRGRDPAEALGLKPATVKTRFLRARRRLQDALAPELRATLADSFAFAGVDCESLTERVVQAWCGDATSAT
jgi:RNA polymerase sigma-70 factor, ECF subfamily